MPLEAGRGWAEIRERSSRPLEGLNRYVDLQQVTEHVSNILAELKEMAQVASLGQIRAAWYEVGGQYQRDM